MRLLTVKEMGEYLNMPKSSAYQILKRLPPEAIIRLNDCPKAAIRIDADALESWLVSRRGQ